MNGFLIGAISGLIVLAYVFRGFTTVEQGYAKAIMCLGKRWKIIGIPPKGNVFDKQWNVIDAPPTTKQKKSGLFFLWIPFIVSVFKYKFSWTSLEQNGQEKENTDRILDGILLKDYVYLVTLEGAETKDMVPLDVKMLLTIQISNPDKALFGVENWLRATTNKIAPVVRAAIALMTFEEVVQKKEELSQQMDTVLQASDIDEHLKIDWGINLKSIGFRNIAPSGELAQKFVEAATKKYMAEKEKEAIVILANAEVERINKVITELKKHGKTGQLVRTLEAIEKASVNGKAIVIPAEFTQFLQALRGGDKS